MRYKFLLPDETEMTINSDHLPMLGDHIIVQAIRHEVKDCYFRVLEGKHKEKDGKEVVHLYLDCVVVLVPTQV